VYPFRVIVFGSLVIPEIWSAGRYKIKEGFEGKFIEKLKLFSPEKTKARPIIEIEENNIADIRQYANMDDLLEI
jgi:hypothetical protein